MAVTAKFQADFTTFYEAVQKADAQLKDFQSGAGQVEKSVNRLADAFSGRKIIQEATLAAKAVNDIGGVSVLTEKELQSLGAKASEAIAKMQATGIKDIPKDLQAIADAAEHAATPTSSLFASIASGVTAGNIASDAFEAIARGILSVAEAVPALLAHSIALGDSLYTMSLKTGASVENLSALKFAAEESGVDFDRMTTSFFMLERALGQTGTAAKQVQDVIGRLGLDFQALKNESPDQAFIDVVTAISKVPNEADRARDAMVLFGRGGREIMGLLNTDVQAVMQSARDLGLVMTTDQAAAAHAATVGWEAFQAQLEQTGVEIASVIVPALVALERLASDAFSTLKAEAEKSLAVGNVDDLLVRVGEGFIDATAAAAGFGAGATQALVNVLSAGLRLGQALDSIGYDLVKIATLGTADPKGKTALDQLAASFKNDYDTFQSLKGSIGSAGDVVSAAFGALEQVADKMAGKFSGAFASAREEIRTFADAATRLNGASGVSDVFSDGAAGADKFQKAVSDINALLAGPQGLDGNIEELVKYFLSLGASQTDIATYFDISEGAVKAIADEMAIAKEQTRQWNEYVKQLNQSIHQIPSQDLEKLFPDNTSLPQNADDNTQKFNKDFILLQDVGKAATEHAQETVAAFDATDKKTKDWEKSLSETSRALSQLATVSGGTFGGIVRDLAQVAEATNTVAKGIDSINTKSTGLEGTISKISGVISIVTGGISILEGIGKALGIGQPSAAELQTRKDRQSVFSQDGLSLDDKGIQTAEDALTRFGASSAEAQKEVAAALDAKTPAAFAAAMAPVNAALAKAASVDKQVSSVQSLVSAYIQAGHVIPEALRQTLTDLETMPGLTDDERQAITDLVTASQPDFESLTQKAAALGISLQGLGPKFQQGELNQQFGDVWQTLQDLINAGADWSSIITSSVTNADGSVTSLGKTLGHLVEQSEQFGTTIPDNMKPYLQDLADAGQLTDDAGHKITDLSKVQFAPSMQTSLDTLNTTIQNLITTLVGGSGLQSAIDSIHGKDVTVNVQYAAQGADAAMNQVQAYNQSVIDAGGPATPPPTSETQPGGEIVPGASTGGMVTPSGIDYLASGGRVLPFPNVRSAFIPEGTDTVPAMLTPGEMVLTASQQKAIVSAAASIGSRAASGGAQPDARQPLVVNLYLPDGKLLTQAVIDNIAYNKGGAKTKARRALGIKAA